MKKLVLLLSLFAATVMSAQELNRIPAMWRWTGDHQVAFTYDFRGVSKDDFVLDAATHKRSGVTVAPAARPMPGMPGTGVPFQVKGAENLRYSPDSTKMAFTRDNDLWIVDVATKEETRLTSDGSDVILNGYSSWVYYEEILGRGTRYCAFWWSPDSICFLSITKIRDAF